MCADVIRNHLSFYLEKFNTNRLLAQPPQGAFVMRLTNEHISDFQKLYQEEFGISLSGDEALERATKLIEFVQVIYKPITKEDYKKYKQIN